MAQITYEEVVRLAEQLTVDEQRELIAHLEELAQHQALSAAEWDTLLISARVSIPPGPDFSDRRADWYDDDGR